MASTLRTKLRIAASVVFAPGFFDAVAGRFLWQRGATVGTATPETTPDDWLDLTGALHAHSTYSDGAGDVPTVVEGARAAGADFLLLTDHNTQRPLRDGWQDKFGDESPLLLIGTEVTVKQGAFLLALDMPPAWEPVPHLLPQDVIDDVNAHGGLPLVSLPFDVKHPWRDWDATGCVGLEVINVSTIARRHINFLSLFWLMAVQKAGGIGAALRAIVTRPDQALARWDAQMENGTRRVVGIAALDAHALMKIGTKKYPVPSYTDSFRVATTHVLLPKELHDACADARRAAIYEAFREGRCYMAYDCLGNPTGFRFTTDRGAVMGESVAANGGQVRLAARIPSQMPGQKTLTRLLRNGEIVAAAVGSVLTCCASEPGAYRTEVYQYTFRVGPVYFGTRPWIFSNPIYVEIE